MSIKPKEEEETYINHCRVGERVWLEMGDAARVESPHGHEHFLGFGSSIWLLALGPTIDDSVEHVRVRLKVRVPHGIHLV